MAMSDREINALRDIALRYDAKTGRLKEVEEPVYHQETEEDAIQRILNDYAFEWMEHDELAKPDLIDPDDITGDKIDNLGIF